MEANLIGLILEEEYSELRRMIFRILMASIQINGASKHKTQEQDVLISLDNGTIQIY